MVEALSFTLHFNSKSLPMLRGSGFLLEHFLRTSQSSCWQSWSAFIIELHSILTQSKKKNCTNDKMLISVQTYSKSSLRRLDRSGGGEKFRHGQEDQITFHSLSVFLCSVQTEYLDLPLHILYAWLLLLKTQLPGIMLRLIIFSWEDFSVYAIWITYKSIPHICFLA